MRITRKSGEKNGKNRFFIDIKKNRLYKLYFFALALFILACDQFSKNWIIRQFEPGESWPIVKGIFHLTYVRNPGAAFGILAFRTSFFIIISLLMIFLIIYGERFFTQESFSLRLGMSLLAGGATGNLIDRMKYGYVVDFLDFKIWPVFNVADISLVVGIVLLFYGLQKSRFLSFK